MADIIKRNLFGLCTVALTFTVSSSALTAAPVSAMTPVQTVAEACTQTILGFPAWYNGLPCSAGTVDQQSLQLNSIWVIVLNIVQWIIMAAGYVAVTMIIWSGFKYIKSQGDASEITSAKNSIAQAIGGVVIAIAAVMIVRYVQGIIQ
ncbi:MAG: hypothetical protein WBB39_05160 [Candidatus Saccharimonadales bacterium]